MVGLALNPTAQTLLLVTAVTPSSCACMPLPAGFGVDTMLHLLPFQCSARVFAPAVPTAQTSVLEMAATELSRLAYGSGLGLLAIDQAEGGPGVWVRGGVR